MDEVEVEAVAEVEVDDPVLVEGLPGVGHVGKLAAEHLVEELDSELVRRVHSQHFPPQVGLDEDAEATLACAEFYAVHNDERDLLVLVGDHQATEAVGHYRLAETFLDVAESFGVSEVLALGGVPTGEIVEEYDVIGAATANAARDGYLDAGVTFPGDEPEGGIVGTSGLLLGLGARRDMEATCLMGRTSGYVVDPKSARAVLEIIESVLGVTVDFTSLEERAEEMEEVVSEIQQMQGEDENFDPTTAEKNLRYFG